MKKLFTKKDKRTELEKKYDEAVLLLGTYLPGSDEYNDWMTVIERMNAMVVAERESRKNQRVSADTIANGAVGLAQVGAILLKEQFYNINTKALGFVKKAR